MAVAAATSLPRLVREVLKAFRKQPVDDRRLDSVSLYAAGPTADLPEWDTAEWQEDDHDQQGNLFDPIKAKSEKQEEIDWLSSRKRVHGAARPTPLAEMRSKEQGRQCQSTTGCERNQEGQN